MAFQVEAKSLSDITQLAANPPKYPRNPTEQLRDPLTLYIARVPGIQGEPCSNFMATAMLMEPSRSNPYAS